MPACSGGKSSTPTAFAMIPMQDPALALRELERASKLEGMRGLYLATSVDGVELDEIAT